MKVNATSLTLQIRIIIGCLLASSACILLVPVAHNQKGLTMLCSSLFWGFMLIGDGRFWRIYHVRKKQIRKLGKHRIGILAFFQNPMAKCADCLFFAGMILLLISMKAAFLQGYIQFILCCLVLFSFHMHCILNGNVYRYILLETGRERK